MLGSDMSTTAIQELIAQLRALGIPDWATARHIMNEAADTIQALQAENTALSESFGALGLERDELRQQVDAVKGDAERLHKVFELCTVTFWPGNGAYPIEHNMNAVSQKDSKNQILAAIDAAKGNYDHQT